MKRVKRKRKAVEDDPVVAGGGSIVPNEVASTATAASSTPSIVSPAVGDELPTGAMVTKELRKLEFALEQWPTASADALCAVNTLLRWAQKTSDNSFVRYFQTYGGTARVLDVLKETMSDAKLVLGLCNLLSWCMSNVAAEVPKTFLELDGVQTLLLANDEHSATNRGFNIKVLSFIWCCLSWAANRIAEHAQKKEQVLLLTDAACDLLTKLSTFKGNKPEKMDLVKNLLVTLSHLMSRSVLNVGDVLTKNIVPAAIKVTARITGTWEKNANSALAVSNFFLHFCNWWKSNPSELTISHSQALLALYVKLLTKLPMNRTVSMNAISFLEKATGFVDKNVVKSSGVCIGLSQFEQNNHGDEDLKKRARKLVIQLFNDS